MTTMPTAKTTSRRPDVAGLEAGSQRIGHETPAMRSCRNLAAPSLREDGDRGCADSEAVLDPRVDQLGEGEDLRADERAGDGDDHQDDDDLRNEGQRHLLHLGQRLEQRDDDADDHRGADRRARGDDDRPDRRLDDVEGVASFMAQLMVTPGPSGTLVPSSSVATAPPWMMDTDATLPVDGLTVCSW